MGSHQRVEGGVIKMNRRTILKRSAFLFLATAVLGGCSIDTTAEPEDVGRVIVTITDENNAPVSGILVDLFLPNNAISPFAAATTNASGTAEFGASAGGVTPQSYIVRVISLTTYDIAANETNNKPVTVVANQTATVTFKLTKRPIGQQ
jgi:hypothetical protein